MICPLGTGASGHDFIQQLHRGPHRWHLTPIPTAMGGDNAADLIAQAITTAGHGPYQAVVVCRGGGSAVDLSPFDSEPVARAIVECPLPVIVAVGHASDTHLADLVAHHSVPTPSAAAEWFNDRRSHAHHRAAAMALRVTQAQADIQARHATRALHDAEQAAATARTAHQRARVAIAIAVVVIIVAVLVVALMMVSR